MLFYQIKDLCSTRYLQEEHGVVSFSLCGIEPGEVVEFWYTYRKPSGIWCPVLDGEHVEYEGRALSLSGLARRLTGAERGVPGPSYFKYRGEWLNDLRDRLGR